MQEDYITRVPVGYEGKRVRVEYKGIDPYTGDPDTSRYVEGRLSSRTPLGITVLYGEDLDAPFDENDPWGENKDVSSMLIAYPAITLIELEPKGSVPYGRRKRQ